MRRVGTSLATAFALDLLHLRTGSLSRGGTLFCQARFQLLVLCRDLQGGHALFHGNFVLALLHALFERVVRLLRLCAPRCDACLCLLLRISNLRELAPRV
jgi:hypothetical protein